MEEFWSIRSENYDRLFWTRDDSYISEIIKCGDFHDNHVVLDVGTGTGIMAQKIKPLVSKVVAIDSSEAMIEKGMWDGVSFLKWDIGERIFRDGIFDRVVARMVFHHIPLSQLPRAIVRCYDLLKEGGKLVVAEGIPPSGEKDVVKWFTEMFKMKEERTVFTSFDLVNMMIDNGLRLIDSHVHVTRGFNLRNWLENSGLDKYVQASILDVHINAPESVKRAYNFREENGEYLIDCKNVIIVGER